MSEIKRCCKTVYTQGGTFRGRQCTRNAKVERDGKHYCGIHDPITRSEKADQRYAKWKEKNDSEMAKRNEFARRAACFDALVAALEGIIYHAITSVNYSHSDDIYTIEEIARAALAHAKGEA